MARDLHRFWPPRRMGRLASSALFNLLAVPASTQGITIESRTATSLSVTTSGTPRKVISWPVSLPVGTRIEMTLTCSRTTYVRFDDDVLLEAPGILDIVSASGLTAGSYAIDYTVTAAAAARPYFGILQSNGVFTGSIAITGFKVTPP